MPTSKQTQADEPAEVTPRESKGDAVEPGKPVGVPAVSQMGATFAERAGKKAPTGAKKANTTFADRAKSSSKAVKADGDEVENKAVASAAKKS